MAGPRGWGGGEVRLSIGPDRRNVRHRVHVTALAQVFGLVPTAVNSGRKQVILLVKTTSAGSPDADTLSATLDRLTSRFGDIRKPRRRASSPDPSPILARGPPRSGAAVAPPIGGVVGAHAPELTETNVGNRMLRGMGWSPGTGLGASRSGILVPVTATVRAPRRGLGA